jgi:hypothetical protein
MNKREKRPRRLTLHRETLLRLDDRKLRGIGGDGGFDPIRNSQDRLCTSPWCGPTTCGCDELVG